MPGRLDAKTLDSLVRKGEIDTVLAVVPDGFGRLMGKRLTGRHFVEHVLEDGVHACIYLFTVDMEMEPLPGFKLTSWERGYGDFHLMPDLTTLRVASWLDRSAIVLCDVLDPRSHDLVPIAPRTILRAQVDRAAEALGGMGADVRVDQAEGEGRSAFGLGMPVGGHLATNLALFEDICRRTIAWAVEAW